jgi:hypothetical protein
MLSVTVMTIRLGSLMLFVMFVCETETIELGTGRTYCTCRLLNSFREVPYRSVIQTPTVVVAFTVPSIYFLPEVRILYSLSDCLTT